MDQDTWYSCYTEPLNNWIHQDAFSHPAKASVSLAKRIIVHAKTEGWIDSHHYLLDPMGGVGVFCLVAASEGIPSVAIELEPRFVDFFHQNVERHRREWEALGKPLPYVIHGDARRLRELITQAGLVVSSPPYSHAGEVLGTHNGIDYAKCQKPGRRATAARVASGEDYGRTSGQVGAMPEGDLRLILSSPPYAGSQQVDERTKPASAMSSTWRLRQGHITVGQAAGQLAYLPEGSLRAIVTSPPYANTDTKPSALGSGNPTRADGDSAGRNKGDYHYPQGYGQIGNLSHDTYWSEMAKIYAACYDILPVGSHCILVVKGFVRQRQYIDLPMQTVQLLEHLGFTVEHYHRAMLSSQVGQLTLDGGEFRKSRKSFFRRLAEKNGAPVIDHEAVVCAVKPEAP